MQWILVILTTWWNSTKSYEDQHSPSNNITYQHAPCHAGYLRISVYLFNGSLFWSNNILHNNLCHYVVFSTSEFPANVYTFITHGLALASNIHTPSSHYDLSPQVLLILLPILCTSIIPIHKPYFFPYMVLNTNIIFETNLSILSNTITKFISPNRHARKTSATLVRFLHILQLRFNQVTQLSGFYFSKKNYCGCLVPTSFSCSLLVQEFLVDKCTLLKACVCYFLSYFCFSPNDRSSKLWKMFFISCKKLFSFAFLSFLPCQPLL